MWQMVYLQWHHPVSVRPVPGGFRMFVGVPARWHAPQHVQAPNQDLVYLPRVGTLANKKPVPSLLPEELVAQPDSDLAHAHLTACQKRNITNCEGARQVPTFQTFPRRLDLFQPFTACLFLHLSTSWVTLHSWLIVSAVMSFGLREHEHSFSLQSISV